MQLSSAPQFKKKKKHQTESLRMPRNDPSEIQRFNFIREFLINDVWVGFKFPNYIPTILTHHLGKV